MRFDLGILVSTFALGACIDDGFDPPTDSDEQDVLVQSTPCDVLLDLSSESTTQRYTFTSSRVQDNHCSSVTLRAVTGNRTWHAHVEWAGFALTNDDHCADAFM